MAKKNTTEQLPKQSKTKNSEKNTEVSIKDFSILLDVANVIADRQEKLNKKIESNNKTNKDLKKEVNDVSKKFDSFLEENKKSTEKLDTLVTEQQKSNKILEDSALAAEFAEEKNAEAEKEKQIKEDQATEKEEKDRAIIISKLTALEKKDFTANIEGGSGGFGLFDLLKGLAALAAAAGLLTAGFLGLKNLLDDIFSGDFFTDKDTRAPELAAAVTGAGIGLKAGEKAKPDIKKGKENLDKAKTAAKEAVTGKAEEAAKSVKTEESKGGKKTPARDAKGRFVKATAEPVKSPAPRKMSVMERLGRGTRATIDAAKGTGQLAKGVGAGVRQSVSLKGMGSAAGIGAGLGGATEGIIAYGSGASAKDVAISTGYGAAKGLATGVGFEVAGGLASTAGALVGGTAGRALTYSVPILGWGLLIYDLIKTAANSGDMGREIASSQLLSDLDERMKLAIAESEKLTKQAELIKESDPEQYNRMIEMANNNIMANAKAFTRYHSTVEAENALNEIVDMEKWFQVGPFGLWDRGSSYTVNDLDNVIKGLEKVPGKSAADKINLVINKPDEYRVPGLTSIVDSLGVEDTAKLVTEGAEIIKTWDMNQKRDAAEYINEKFPNIENPNPNNNKKEKPPQAPEGKQNPTAETPPPETTIPQMRKGAALVHSKSPSGMPVMAGEKGNPEAIIPLNKFDEIIPDYLEHKRLSVKMESKSYDGITSAMRESFLKEQELKAPQSGQTIINNVTGTSSRPTPMNYQYQTSLAKTFDNVFDEISRKNFIISVVT